MSAQHPTFSLSKLRSAHHPHFRALQSVELLEDRTVPVAFPIGPQFTVAATMGLEAQAPVAAVVNPEGDFVSVWESFETDGSGIGIYAQRFQADGIAIGKPALVNDTTPGNQSHPAIATDGAGHVVIAWQSEVAAGGSYDVFYKTGDVEAGTDWLTAEMMVNATADGNQIHPTTAMDADGRFVIVWQTDQNQETTGLDIYAATGSYPGGLSAGEFAINAAEGDQRDPVAAMAKTSGDGAGQLITAWVGPGTGGEEEEPTNVVRGTLSTYDSAFTLTPVADHIDYQLSAAAQHDQVRPDVAMAPDGRFVVVWQAEGGQGSGSDVFSRRFDVAGNGLDKVNIRVNTTTQEPQRYPSVGIDQNGDYFIAWQGQKQDARSWGIIGRAFKANGSEAKAEFIINDTTQRGPQTTPSVAVGENGKTVAVWAGPLVPEHGGHEEEEPVGEGGHKPAVHARLFNTTGTVDVLPDPSIGATGFEFLLATVGAGEDVPAAAAVDGMGNYIVVWQSFEEADDPSGMGVYAQRVDPVGNLVGPKILVNQTTLGYQSHPTVAAAADGRFIVAWQAETRDGNGYDIYARLFHADGTPAEDEFLINEGTQAGNQTAPAIAADATGNFVVVWQTEPVDSGEEISEIYARRYSRDGTPDDVEFRVNTEVATSQNSPRVPMNAVGQLGVVWVSDHPSLTDPNDTEKSVFVRWFDSDGTPAGPEFPANVYTKDAQEHPEIGLDSAGNMVVVWQSINQEIGAEGVSWGTFARQFQPDGTSPQMEEFLVNETIAGPQRYPGIGVDGDGYFSVAWQTINQDGSSWAVYQRQYRPDGTPETGEQIVNTETQGPQVLPVYARMPTGDFAIFWVGLGAGHVEGVHGRIYDANTPPTVSAPEGMLPDVMVPEDAAPTLIDLHALFEDDYDPDSALTYAVVGNTHPDLFSGVSFDPSTGQLQLAYTSDASGSAVLTLRVTDTWDLFTEASFNVTVIPVADDPTLTVSDVSGGERTTILLDIAAALTDTDGSESLAIQIEGVPEDVTLSAGTDLGGGVWALTPEELVGLSVTSEREQSFTLTVTATSTEEANGDSASTVNTMRVTFNPVADPPILTVSDAVGNERWPIPLAIEGSVIDTDGTESLSLTIAGLPTGATLSAGTDLGDGTWRLTPDDLPGLTVTLPHEMTVRVTVTATSTEEANGDTATTVRPLTVTALNVDYYAIGAGDGGGPVVKLYELDGTMRSTFFAYDPAFRGGVNVAVGDVTGDGIPDLVTGAGSGGGPHVKVFDGVTGAEVRSFFAYDSSFRGGVNVAVGDVTGDGVEDIVTGAGVGGGPHVKVFDGVTGAEVRSFFAYDSSFRGGVNVAAGDLDGEGFAEIVTGSGDGGGPHVTVFDGLSGDLLHNFMAGDPIDRSGIFVAMGNVQGDGRLDVVTGTGAGQTAQVVTFDGHDLAEVSRFNAFEATYTCGVRVATVDLDGDGFDEILLGPCVDGGPRVRIIDGVTGEQLANFFAYDPAFLGGISVGG